MWILNSFFIYETMTSMYYHVPSHTSVYQGSYWSPYVLISPSVRKYMSSGRNASSKGRSLRSLRKEAFDAHLLKSGGAGYIK